MNKLFTKIAKIFLGLSMAAGVGVAVSDVGKLAEVRADQYSYTFTSKQFTANESKTLNGVSWTLAGDGGYYGYDNTKGQQFGSGSSPYKTFSLSTTGISGTITQIVVNASGANSVSATMTCKVGGANFGTTAQTISSSAANKTFNGSASGKVDITMTQTSSKALYIKSIAVTYTAVTTYTVTINVNNNSYGTVNKTSVTGVTSGTSISASGSTLSVGTTSVTATPTTSSAQTSYGFSNWTGIPGSGTVTGNITVTANFTSSSHSPVSLSISGSMTNTEYDQGDPWDPAGFTVNAVYDGPIQTPVNVTSEVTWSYSPETTASVSTKSVTCTATFGSLSATSTAQSVTINKVTVNRYELVTSTDNLTAGSSYIIGNVDGSAFMSTTQNSNNRGKQNPAKAAANGIVEYTSGFEVITLGGQTGAWTFLTTNPESNSSGSIGYLYAASGSSNWLRTQASNNANGEWSISIAQDGAATVLAQGTNTRNKMRYNGTNNPPIFSCYASDATTGTEPAFWKLVDASENIAINKESVTDMKDNVNHEVQITANNFDPTSITVTYSTANVATVTAGTIDDGIIPLNVSCDAVGSTTATISVLGGEETLSVDLDITVTPRPASLTLVNATIQDGVIEVKLGGSKQVSFSALDTDGESYSIDYSGITASSTEAGARLSGTSVMVINGDAVCDATVTCTITVTEDWDTPITQTLTVHVIEDFNDRNVNISVINGVDVEQGETLNISDHISSATATTYFGTTNHPILDDELLFSWTNNRANGVKYSSFIFDVVDQDKDAGEFEERTVYVFVTFSESYAGTSFTVDIEVQDRPVIGLIVDGVEKSNGDDINLQLPRISTYNLNEHVTVNPSNATESHVVNYEIEDGAEYVSLNNGVVTVGSKTGTTVACISASPEALDTFVVYFWISITRESMTITADVPSSSYSMAKSLSIGDEVVIVNTGDSMELTGVSSNLGTATSYSGTPSKTYVLTVGQGSEPNSFTFSHGTDYLAYTSSGGNKLYTISSPTSDEMDEVSWTVSFDETSATVTSVYSTGRQLQYNANSGQERFCCYGGTQQPISFYKQQTIIVETEVTVTDDLFNIINNAMSLKDGSSTLYDLGLCNSSGTSFDVSKWNTLGSSFTSSIISDNKLAYARADENGNEIEQFLAVYDYVIGKKESGYVAYASANDFLGRVDSGKITASPRVNPLVNIIGENTNTVAIIVIISTVSVTAIGGYFFLRKRKETN